jgi:hypothetical protein
MLYDDASSLFGWAHLDPVDGFVFDLDLSQSYGALGNHV